jgi:hypothetical protein
MISLQKTVFCENRPYWGWTQSDGGSEEPQITKLIPRRAHSGKPSLHAQMGLLSTTKHRFLNYFKTLCFRGM